MNTERICWCGNKDLSDFSPAYFHCKTCGTLVLRDWPEGDITKVQDLGELYGQDYYLKHLPLEYGYPSLSERARADLSERIIFWTKTLLRYKLPPARVLELGSAHGGFIAMLRQAGYDATGLELSPWLVQYSKSLFNIPVLQGPLEKQELAPASLDTIALMDVLEHLPDPCQTMKKAIEALAPDGILLIQTPDFQEEKSFAELQESNDPFLAQFKEKEHLFLYSRRAIQELYSRLGYSTITFEPAIFAHYDMFFIASKQPIQQNSPEEISQALQKTPAGRIVQGLLDLYDQNHAHLTQLHETQAQLHEAQAQRHDFQVRLEYTEAQLQEAHREAQAQLQRADGWLQEAYANLEATQAELQTARQALTGLRSSRLYKLLRRLGAWPWLDPLINHLK